MAEPAIRALLPYLVVKKTEALHLLQLRRLKAEGKQGVTEWVHANRWRDSVRMRKRCYTTPRWLLSNEFAKLSWLCTRRCRGSRSDAKHESHGPVRGHPNPGGRKNRDDPRPEDPQRDPPPDRGQALRRADSHDRGGNHVGGAHRDPSQRAARERDAAPGLGGEALPGSQVRHALRHRTDDTPAAEECPERDGGMGTDDDPERDRELARRGTPGRSDRRDDEDQGDDPHPFLSVIRPVRHAIEEARDELQAFELVVDLRRGVSAEQADDHERDRKSTRLNSSHGY